MSNIESILENAFASLDKELSRDSNSSLSAFESFVMSDEDVFVALESKESVAEEKGLVSKWLRYEYRPELDRFAEEVRAFKKAKDKKGTVECMKKHVANMKKIESDLSKIKVENSNEDKLREAKNLLKVFAITNTAIGVVGALVGWLVPMSNMVASGVKGIGIGAAAGAAGNFLNIGVLGAEIHAVEKGLKENSPKYVEQIKDGKTSAQQYKDKMIKMVQEYIFKTEKCINKIESKLKEE